MRTLIIGDIHGNLKALNDSLDKANFNIKEDRIICVGDYVDGWENSFEVVDTLLAIKKQSKFENIFLLGNHDKWFLDILDQDFDNLRNERYIEENYENWYYQGGKATYDSYVAHPNEVIKQHKSAFFDSLKYFHQENNQLFVHAGFPLDLGFEETWKTHKSLLLWDRSLYNLALQSWTVNKNLSSSSQPTAELAFGNFESIFIGHTSTTNDGIDVPTRMANVINVDQGCKGRGVLTIWELETGKYYQNIE